MSEAPPEGGNTSGETPPADTEFKPITSQDDLNRVLADRIKREQAKFGDYKDMKAKAARLDEIEAANQSEAEKAAARLAEAESKAVEAERRALRFEIASEFQLTPEQAKKLVHVSSEEGIREIAEALAQKTALGKKTGNHVPREGSTPPASETPESQFARDVFGGSTQT